MNFEEKLKQNLNSLKLEITNDEGSKIAYLELITEKDENNFELIDKITKWREKFRTCFLSEFTPTFERTQKWMNSSVLENKNRVLFKIFNIDNILVGHVGAIFKGSYIEYDYFIIGGRIGFRHSSVIIAKKFLQWIIDVVDVDYLFAQVRSDNLQAIRFHLKTGFRIHNKIPLKKVITDKDEFHYVKTNDSGCSSLNLLEIRAYKNDFNNTALI